MQTEIKVSYQITTPLFCGGADYEHNAEIRLPSFKGVLRYWFRALAWSRCKDLNMIKKVEGELFGSSETGQAKVSMYLVQSSEESAKMNVGDILTIRKGQGKPIGDGARYLGYGVMETFSSPKNKTQAGQLKRACLRAPTDMVIQMQARNLNDFELTLLVDALKALGTLGGMGAKSRKGYGSMNITHLSVNDEPRWQVPRSINDLSDYIKEFRSGGLVDRSPNLPDFTALSDKTRHILISSEKSEPLELLDLVGRELVRYRSWGRGGKIFNNIDSEKIFKDDHDLMKKDKHDKHPRRVAFGLPHNYGRKQVLPTEYDRRASPLFIHIHKCSDMPVAVISFLPALFLPQEKSHIKVGRDTVKLTPESELYKPIHDFLDRLLSPEKRKEPFTKAMEVRHDNAS